MSIVLAKDAFLVFRALCKLSIRSSESSTGTDPTAVRGKVRFLTTSLSKYMGPPIWYLGCMQQLPPCTSPLILPLLSSPTSHMDLNLYISDFSVHGALCLQQVSSLHVSGD